MPGHQMFITFDAGIPQQSQALRLGMNRVVLQRIKREGLDRSLRRLTPFYVGKFLHIDGLS